MSSTLNLFRNAKDYKEFSTGETLFREGDPGDVMYVVKEGEVDIVLHDKVIETVSVGGIIGEMALIDNEPRSATAVAHTTCQVVPIDQKRFSFMVQETPNFAMQVMKVMVHRLRAMDNYV